MSTQDPLEKAVERSATRIAIDAVAKSGFDDGWSAALEVAALLVERGLTGAKPEAVCHWAFELAAAVQAPLISWDRRSLEWTGTSFHHSGNQRHQS